MRKYLIWCLIVLQIFSYMSCNKKLLSEKEITLVMAEVNPAESIAGQMDQAFKQKVEELSGGKIKIDLQCSGILGDIETLMSMATSGGSSVQILRLSPPSFAPYDCPKTLMLSTPFTFSSKEHFWKFANSQTAQALWEEPLQNGAGLRCLFVGEEGFRHFFSTKEIKTVEDFNGLKVRGTNDKAMQGILKGLKADSISVNYVDLYGALQTGVIEAAEQPIANYLTNHFNKVAPHMILDGHTLGIMIAAITEECWQELTPGQRDILIEAGKYASEFCKKLSQTEEDTVKAQLVDEGASLVEVNDIKVWQDSCKEIIEDCAKADPALYQEILSYAN